MKHPGRNLLSVVRKGCRVRRRRARGPPFTPSKGNTMTPTLNAGDTAWVLASAALVLLMTPGLAFFYGGMTRAKSVLNMMMMSWVAIITVTIAWVLYGDSLA